MDVKHQIRLTTDYTDFADFRREKAEKTQGTWPQRAQRTWSSIAASKKIYPQISQIFADYLGREGLEQDGREQRECGHEFSLIDTN